MNCQPSHRHRYLERVTDVLSRMIFAVLSLAVVLAIVEDFNMVRSLALV